MNALKSPRLWLFVWGGLGAVALLYFIVAASVQPNNDGPSALKGDRSLLVGEMADFQYTALPRTAPAVAFQYEGRDLTLADFRGRAVLINFWATTCLPCLEEMPALDALQTELGGRKFEVVAVAADPQGPEAAQAYLDRLNISALKLYMDQRLIFTSAMGVDVFPMSVLYDAQGREVGRLIGKADWQSPEAIRLVASAIP